MSVETIARRYGTALADVVIKTGETETVKAELRSWQELIDSNADLKSAFKNPSIAYSGKQRVLDSLVSKVKPTGTTANFLRVLLKNGRLGELGEINERFASILEERSGSVAAEVTSARELSESQKSELGSNLEKLTAKQVRLAFSVDPTLIGGIVTRVGSTVYDSSIRSQLENLREELINA